MKGKFIVWLVLVFAAGILATQVDAANLVVGPGGDYATIQAAVDAAADGDVIKVKKGTYPEQVEIRDLDELVIQGQGAVITVPEDGMVGQLVKIVDCEDVHFDGFVIDGAEGAGVGYGARNSGGDTDTRFYGILMLNSSGKVSNNTIQDVSWGNGVQQGVGFYAMVLDGIFRNVAFTGNTVTNFQKNGATFYGPIAAKIHDNYIQGWGDSDVIAQNCLQVGGDPSFTASITKNVILDSTYTGPNWASTGILAMSGCDNLRIVNNTISDTMVGIFVITDSKRCKIINNKGSGNIWDYYSYEADTKVHANKFE